MIMCPKDYQPSSEPKRTPGTAEGSEEDVDSALSAKGMQAADKNQQAGRMGQSPGGSEPNHTPGVAEG
jgi:hypothetical protein